MQKIPKDPIMCLSFVNTQLRDAYNSLEELCRAFDVKKEELEERLAAVGRAALSGRYASFCGQMKRKARGGIIS